MTTMALLLLLLLRKGMEPVCAFHDRVSDLNNEASSCKDP